MAKYSVVITRDITESTVVEVEAANPDEAATAATDKMLLQEFTDWEVDDGSWNNSDLYITDTTETN